LYFIVFYWVLLLVDTVTVRICTVLDIDTDILVNCNWVDSRWQ